MELKPLKLDKKGQIGLDVVKGTMVSLLVLAVLGVAVFLALSSLQDASLFTSGSTGETQTDNVVGNVTTATASFFGNTGTIFSILVAVVIMLAIAIIVAVVNRFGRTA
jgi:uncharacterized membrane protein